MSCTIEIWEFGMHTKSHTNWNGGHTTYSSGKDFTVNILHGQGMQKSNHEGQNDITSLCISQDPSLSNARVCTCSHETNIVRTCCIVLKESQYNMTSDDVKQAYHTDTVHPQNLFVENVINFS